MGVRDRLLAGLARQLGRPSGVRGRLVGGLLNRANRRTVAEAIEGLALPSGAVVADIGFGGAVGLGLLIAEVGAAGQVHGVELSQTMLS
ncbi:MAG: SAM-dependent methyltransferase, partial [Geodermatophilaceae bacterium]|nr:SAM-dependent methyltransferase [Geodermatophilaceae bacterium]